MRVDRGETCCPPRLKPNLYGAFMYGPKPVPFKIYLWGSFFGDLSSGARRRWWRSRKSGPPVVFGPRTLGANVGHPSRGRGLRLNGQSLSYPPKITPLKPRSINEYL